MVIGQPDKITIKCNNTEDNDANTHAKPDSLCVPYQIKFDKQGNLFVVENQYECHGNNRVTIFLRSDLQNATGLFPRLAAKKVFNAPNLSAVGNSEGQNCGYEKVNQPGTPVSIAFNNSNQLIIGSDGYYGNNRERQLRQLYFYSDPLNKQTPDGYFNIPMGAPGEIVVDNEDRLIIQDHTWSRVWAIDPGVDRSWLVSLTTSPVNYIKNPLSISSPSPSPVQSPSPSPSPFPSPSPIQSPSPTPPSFPSPSPAISVSEITVNGDRLSLAGAALPLTLPGNAGSAGIFDIPILVKLSNNATSPFVIKFRYQPASVISSPSPSQQPPVTPQQPSQPPSNSGGSSGGSSGGGGGGGGSSGGSGSGSGGSNVSKPPPPAAAKPPALIKTRVNIFDFNSDGKISSIDVGLFLIEWRKGKKASLKMDLNKDGRVNSIDYSLLKRQFKRK